jgi:hypothetical protein
MPRRANSAGTPKEHLEQLGTCGFDGGGARGRGRASGTMPSRKNKSMKSNAGGGLGAAIRNDKWQKVEARLPQ